MFIRLYAYASIISVGHSSGNSSGSFSLTQAKEFNYWLFKLRLEYWDPARVASDTRKGLKRMEQVRGTSSPV